MEEFIRNCLKPILNSDVDEEIIQYVKEMKVVEDFEEFIDNVIDKGNAEHVRNYKELKSRLFGGGKHSHPTPNATTKNKKQTQNLQKKTPASSEAFPGLPGNKNKNNHSQQKSNLRTPKQGKMAASNLPNKEVSYLNYTPSDKEGLNKPSEQGHSGGKGKKTKYVNLESFDSTIGIKKGRHPCNCEAKTHLLINNCLKCGRIVCEQEGSGPCFFCDNMVCTNDELAVLESNSKQSDRLYNRLKEQKTSKEWKKAIEARDRLLKADRSGDYKKAIYDDQSDYYAGDKWKSEGSNNMINKIHKSRKDMKLALDFASRMVITAESDYDKHKENLMKGVNKLLDSTEERFPRNFYEVTNDIHNVSVESEEKFLENAREEQGLQRGKIITSRFSKIKVANDAFLSEIDRGMCLSMHQPWASLLVSGIKIHEGRTWYTEHRGRLWIHAASKEPQSSDILEVEGMYRTIYNDPDLVFPRKYPTGCLLGCIFVEECLNQEQYRKFYPEGESDCPFVLICTNPMILPVFYPMQGQHKIFPLRRDIHNKAKEGIMSAKWL